MILIKSVLQVLLAYFLSLFKHLFINLIESSFKKFVWQVSVRAEKYIRWSVIRFVE